MKNVKTKITGNTLSITIDLAENHGPSKSQKNLIIATTEGNVTLDGGVTLGLNLYKKI